MYCAKLKTHLDEVKLRNATKVVEVPELELDEDVHHIIP